MTERFLKAKHWQLFILTFGIPLIFQIILMSTLFATITTQTTPDPTIIFSYMKYFPLLMLLFMALLFGWFWSIAIGLQKKVPQDISMKVKKFKIFFFIPLVYLLLLMLFINIAIDGFDTANPEPNIAIIASYFVIIFPLHFFSIFCILYSMYFVAKTFKTVELQRAVKFGDFAGEFFIMWFYPIGIWIIQPKINKMVEELSPLD
ncbi:hypothetical protein FVB9288_02387 [Flavobacterium sp. CECT 9288]|uniref:hypothetical protein n=1 Tax=Flavobacterium sp. CECT 9288 TaxID=2845819 RepID=UPI001E4D5A8B|nr:hypothetical protein [Flavobacterium sp. CECT 9288]CAH0336676.1 hypothetical protein FVB9288_02387 [Flavobacterium sp. CECT 9288]